MKEDKQIFRYVKEFLLQRINSNSIGNDKTTIEISEVLDLCHKDEKLQVFFDSTRFFQ